MSHVAVTIEVQSAGNRAKDAMEIANRAVGMLAAVAHHETLGNARIEDTGAQMAVLLNKQITEQASDYLESAHHRLLSAVEAIRDAQASLSRLQAKRSGGDA